MEPWQIDLQPLPAAPPVLPCSLRCLQVWGRPSRAALQGWRTFAGLAYASAGDPNGCLASCVYR